MGKLQQFGRALMLPMIALPAAAIFFSLGNVLQMNEFTARIGELFTLGGDAVFSYLPLIFAVGVALGLTENAGNAGMSALIGFFLCKHITAYFGQPGFQLGVAGGIVIGLSAALSYHRFKDIRLPEYIQFFGGSRFVPLFMSFITLFLSYIYVVVGPVIQGWFAALSDYLLELEGIGVFIYGTLHRLLVPSGLHHILNNFAWFQLGSFERPDGMIVYGDLPRFFEGDPEAGIYMAGLYPIMMFALPAIALAIIHEAREDLKPKVRATFMTAALACFFTGVTEPIEFAFLFVAPYLFIIHALLSGAAMWLTYMLDIHHGFAFSAGAIDYVINYHLSQNGALLIPIGLVYGIVYYRLFRFAIRRWQIPTPGREEGSQLDEWAGDIPYRAPLILQALGGKQNIVSIESCITRLRLTLGNDRLIDGDSLRHLGAAGVIRLGGGNVQVVFGTFSELIREEIMKVVRKDFRQVHFHSPVQGQMIPLENVPDEVFAGKIVGEGVAFYPTRGELVSPVAGKITYVHAAKHAVGIQTEDGLEVLLHVGIDTVTMSGKSFEAAVEEGDEVVPGQLLIRFDLQQVRKHAKSIATPMVITNPGIVKSWNFAPFKSVKKGQSSVMSVVLTETPQTGGETHG